jgi:hypothetical protein
MVLRLTSKRVKAEKRQKVGLPANARAVAQADSDVGAYASVVNAVLLLVLVWVWVGALVPGRAVRGWGPTVGVRAGSPSPSSAREAQRLTPSSSPSSAIVPITSSPASPSPPLPGPRDSASRCRPMDDVRSR